MQPTRLEISPEEPFIQRPEDEGEEWRVITKKPVGKEREGEAFT